MNPSLDDMVLIKAIEIILFLNLTNPQFDGMDLFGTTEIILFSIITVSKGVKDF